MLKFKFCLILVIASTCIPYFSCNMKGNTETAQATLDGLVSSYAANKSLSNTSVEKWIQADHDLSGLLNEISQRSKDKRENALAIFHEVSNMYKLPKVSEDVTDQVYEAYEKLGREPTTVCQQLAIINYLYPKADIRNNVLLALYIVLQKGKTGMQQAALIYYGSEEKVPMPCMVLLFGKDLDARISFDKPEGGAWTDTGAVEMWQFYYR
jgi:hypothetical protein